VQKDFKTFPPIPQGGFGIVIVSFLPIEMLSFLGNPSGDSDVDVADDDDEHP
jgi:hypothetical protein